MANSVTPACGPDIANFNLPSRKSKSTEKWKLFFNRMCKLRSFTTAKELNVRAQFAITNWILVWRSVANSKAQVAQTHGTTIVPNIRAHSYSFISSP